MSDLLSTSIGPNRARTRPMVAATQIDPQLAGVRASTEPESHSSLGRWCWNPITVACVFVHREYMRVRALSRSLGRILSLLLLVVAHIDLDGLGLACGSDRVRGDCHHHSTVVAPLGRHLVPVLNDVAHGDRASGGGVSIRCLDGDDIGIDVDADVVEVGHAREHGLNGPVVVVSHVDRVVESTCGRGDIEHVVERVKDGGPLRSEEGGGTERV
mmetsp:Transcript_2791/g.7028  ORF Transcript_2791/g.7028 Transcript_2791/m.7028 type:complete len:214 (-) Transcript_2791:132-773(-)